MQESTAKIVEYHASVDVEDILSRLEDAGMFQTSSEMRDALSGTEHLRDDNPQIGYYWGWLECLEAQEILKNIS
jgi:hypothetical protein